MQTIRYLWTVVLLFTAMVVLVNCATILSGLNQNVDIKSIPEKARVTVNGEYKGETPLTVKLRRGKNTKVKIELEGYEPYELETRKGFNALSLGNILIGGAIGMIIDLSTGSFYTVGPDPIFVELNEQNEDAFRIEVTSSISPEIRESLNKVGELTPKTNESQKDELRDSGDSGDSAVKEQ